MFEPGEDIGKRLWRKRKKKTQTVAFKNQGRVRANVDEEKEEKKLSAAVGDEDKLKSNKVA